MRSARISSNAVVVHGEDGSLIGTGPFRIAHWEPEKSVTLAAHDTYWAGRPFLDTIEIKMGRALRDQELDLESGKSDVASVQSSGIDAYISAQLALPATQYAGYSYTPHTAPTDCKNDGSNPPDAASLCARDQYSAFQVQRDFFTHALNNPDQLRQRVAFALSQITRQLLEAYRGRSRFTTISAAG